MSASAGLIIASLALAILSPTDVAAAIYKWVDEDGRTHYSDKKPDHLNHAARELDLRSHMSSVVSKSNVAATDKVVMYSASWCGVCKAARQYFKAKRIPFMEYDIEKHAKGTRDYRDLKGKGVPIVLLGEQRMDGFSAESFERMYAKYPAIK